MNPHTNGHSAVTSAHQEIEQFLSLVLEPEQTFEIRLLGCTKGAWNNKPYAASGWFKDISRLFEALDKAIEDYHPEGVYFTLNPLPEQFLTRVNHRIVSGKTSTQDNDVLRRSLLLIDLDVNDKPSKTIATDGQLEAAKDRAIECRQFLRNLGWPEPGFSSSGNGSQLLYAIDQENTDESQNLQKAFLEALSGLIGDKTISIDTSVHNASRISRLIGTMNRKGEEVPELGYFHRRSHIIEAPEHLEIVPDAKLLEVIELSGTKIEETKSIAERALHSDSSIDVEAIIEQIGFTVHQKKRQTHPAGDLYVLNGCPFDDTHEQDTGFYIGKLDTGAIFAKCHHNRCQGRNWQTLKEMYSLSFSAPKLEAVPKVPPDLAPYKLWGLDELAEMPEPDWLINGLIAEKQVGVMFGHSGTYKTYIGLGMSMAIAQGTEWNGFGTKQGKVVYIAYETQSALYERCAAYCIGADCLPLPESEDFSLILDKMYFSEESDIERLALTLQGQHMALLVIDTLSRSNLGNDENGTADMGAYMQKVADLAEQIGCAILLIHHSNKAGVIRGSSTIKASADSVIEIVRIDGDDGTRVKMYLDKQRVAEDHKEWYLKVSEVEVAKPLPGGLITQKRNVWIGPTVEAQGIHRFKGTGDQDLKDRMLEMLELADGRSASNAWFSNCADWSKRNEAQWTSKNKFQKLRDELVQEGAVTFEEGAYILVTDRKKSLVDMID